MKAMNTMIELKCEHDEIEKLVIVFRKSKKHS